MYAAEVGENTVRAAGSGIATGAKAVGSGVAAGAKATGKGLAAGAKATRKGVVTAAKVTGKTIETGACATVHGVQNAWHSVETVVDDFNKRLIQENAQKAAVRKRDEAYKFQPEQISAEQGKQKIFTCHANPIAPNYPTSPANHAVRNPKSENRRRAPNNRKYSFYPPIPAHLIN
jgi:hypothetical protein